MDTNESGDHHQVQAAADRAVGGGPPSSARAAAPATASPPAPSATDATVQTRARESEDWWASAAAAAATGIEYPPSDDEEPPTPTQTGANYGTMEGAIMESMEHVERDDVAPVPPVQTAAEYEEMESTIQKSIQQTQSENAPLPPLQIAAGFENMDQATKEPNNGYDSKKRAAPTTQGGDDTPPPSLPAVLPVEEQVETLQRAQDPPTPAVARAPSPPPTDQRRSPSNPGGQQQLPIRPPPPSMMPSPEDDADPPVPALPRDPSMTPLVATLVEDQVVEATLLEDRQEALVSDLPVYDAVQVPEQTRLEKNKKIMIALGMGLLVGAAVAAGVAVRSNNGSSENSATVIERVVLSTARPSESSPPSDVPSVRPTHRPSQSSAPSTNPSQSHSAKPSTKPTPLPSSSPSKIPSSSLRPSPLPSSPPSTYWSSLDWSRQGLGFNGDASFDIVGLAVAFSADASTMAIGAPGYSGNNDRPGYVKVYHREGEGSRWEQRGDTLRGEANGDEFGRSLSLSEDGTTLSVGAPFHDSVGSNSGQVQVYQWDEAALDYVQIGDTLYGAASGDGFGLSLDISNGKILAVGAPYNDANGSGSEQVTIYAWDDASSNFKQRGEAIDGDAVGDRFGISVSLSGNGQKLAVGAPFNESNGSYSGQARVFQWNEATSNYEQLGDSLLGDTAGDLFGWSVSFSRDGTTLAIGAPENSENGQWSGQVKVFAWDEDASNFEQIGQSLYGKEARDFFGRSVALSLESKTLAIGAPQRFAGKPGYAEVYGWEEATLEYKRLGQSLGGESSGDEFGDALALAGNGRDLAVGAPRNDGNGSSSGRVEVFHMEL